MRKRGNTYEQVLKIARLHHCEFPILSPNEIRIRPWTSGKIDMGTMFHVKSDITGYECDDSSWAIRPQVNKNGLVLFSRNDGTGLTINNLTNTEYIVGRYEVISSFLNARKAFANIHRRNFDNTEKKTQDDDATIKSTADCSGLEISLYPLNALGSKVRHLSSSDSNKAVRESIRANHKPEKLYEDINERELCIETQSDLYVAGFPCQPFSTARKKKGSGDEKNGGVFKHILKFITQCLPNALLLENVDYIKHHEKGKTFQYIIGSLEKARTI